MCGVWRYRYHDFFVNETRTENYLVIGYGGDYPWYRVIHGFWDSEEWEHHEVELMVREDLLDRMEKVEVE